MAYKIVFGIYDAGGHCAYTSVSVETETELAKEINFLMNRPRMKSGGFNGGFWELTFSPENQEFRVEFIPSKRA